MSIPVVYDTMVFLQEAARPDRSHATFQAVEDNRVNLALSPALLAEIEDVLNRDRVREKFPALTPNAIKVFISDVLARSTIFDETPEIFNWPQHPDDNHIFNLAIRAKAKFLVTWETRILKLATDSAPEANMLRSLAPDLSIVTPKQLADLLRTIPE